MIDAAEIVGEFLWGAIEGAADWWWGGDKREDSGDEPRPYREALYEERRPIPTPTQEFRP